MINRYMQLKDFVVYFDEENILEFISQENATLSEVQQKLTTLDSVTMALKRESTDASCAGFFPMKSNGNSPIVMVLTSICLPLREKLEAPTSNLE